MENVLLNKMKFLKIVRGQNHTSARDIMQGVGISKRTLYRYIEELKDCGADISYNRKNNSYSLNNDFDLNEWIEEFYL